MSFVVVVAVVVGGLHVFKSLMLNVLDNPHSSLWCEMVLVIRWFSLNYNISAVSLSSDSERLLVALSTRIQEVEMEGGRREEERLYRQLHLGHQQALDPVVAVREIRPSMSILALTK